MTKRMKAAGPVNRNDDIELNIDSLGSEGQGVGRYEGLAVFVPFALPNEHVKAHIIKAASNYAVGKLIAVDTPRQAGAALLLLHALRRMQSAAHGLRGAA